MEIYTSVPPPKPWALKQCGVDCGSTQSLSHSYNVIHSRSLDQLSESVQLCLSVRVQDVKQRPLWLLHVTSLLYIPEDSEPRWEPQGCSFSQSAEEAGLKDSVKGGYSSLDAGVSALQLQGGV